MDKRSCVPGGNCSPFHISFLTCCKIRRRCPFCEPITVVLKTKTKGSTRFAYTGLLGGLEQLKIETRLIDETLRYLWSVMFFFVVVTGELPNAI